MEYVTINYSLNQTYNVHANIFANIIRKIEKDEDRIEIVEEPKIIISSSGQDVEFYINIKIKNKTNISEVLKSFTKKLEEQVKNAINSKPKNIQLILKGRFK